MPDAASSPEHNSYYAKDRKTWRAWLSKHHATAGRVWLILQHPLGIDMADR